MRFGSFRIRGMLAITGGFSRQNELDRLQFTWEE
jgi:hypothetical protein